MNAVVNENECIACGQCVDICPDVFCVEGGKATVRVAPIPSERLFSCCMTAQRCPGKAIILGEPQALMLADRHNAQRSWIAL